MFSFFPTLVVNVQVSTLHGTAPFFTCTACELHRHRTFSTCTAYQLRWNITSSVCSELPTCPTWFLEHEQCRLRPRKLCCSPGDPTVLPEVEWTSQTFVLVRVSVLVHTNCPFVICPSILHSLLSFFSISNFFPPLTIMTLPHV